MSDVIKRLEDQFKTITDMYTGTIILDTIDPIYTASTLEAKNSVDRTTSRSPMSQKFFNSCIQYLALFRARSYHILFHDYSIAKFHYEFSGTNKLTSYNLLWFPCPFSEEYLGIYPDRFEIQAMLDSVPIEEKYQYDDFSFRTPIRIDFDSEYNGDKKMFHPISHLHFQNKNTRTEVNSLYCLYKFLFFIIENCYPDNNYEIHKNKNFITPTMLTDSQYWLKNDKDIDDEIGKKIFTSYNFAVKD